MNPAMEQMMLQLVARRTGMPVDELRAATLGGPSALAARLGIDLPEGFGAPLDVEARPAEPHGPSREDAVRLDGLEARIAELAEHLAEVEEAHLAALHLIDHVASTLGACPSCFGCDSDCPDCGGRGIPGRRRSTDPRTLHRWLTTLARRFAAPKPATPAPQ